VVEATPMVFVPVERVVVAEDGCKLLMSTFTVRERDEAPRLARFSSLADI